MEPIEEVRTKVNRDGFTFSIIIRRPHVIAIMSGKRTSRLNIKGMAICDEARDNYDEEYGVNLAIERAISKYYGYQCGLSRKKFKASQDELNLYISKKGEWAGNVDRRISESTFIKETV